MIRGQNRRLELWFSPIALGALLLTHPAEAGVASFRAEPEHENGAANFSLSWVRLPGAERCAGLAELSERVESYLKRRVLGPPTRTSTLLECSIEPQSSGGWQVRIRMLDRDGRPLGHRDLASAQPDCRAAEEAAALTLALMIDPNAASEAEAGAANVDAARPTSPQQSSPTSAPPERPSERLSLGDPKNMGFRNSPEPAAPGWGLRVDLAAVASVNQLPSPAAGAEAGIRLSPNSGPLGFNLSAAYLLQQDAELRPNAGGSFSHAALGLAGSWSIQRGSTLLAGAELGKIFAEGYGFSGRSHTVSEWSLNAALGFELAWKLSRHFSLALRPTLEAPILRPTFEAADASGAVQPIFRVPALVGSFALAIGYDP